MKSTKILWLALSCLLGVTANSQCEEGEGTLTIEVIPDGWPQEITFELTNLDGTITFEGAGEANTSFCVPLDDCFSFAIYDSFGDGIFEPGGYWIYLDDELMATGYNYGYGETVSFNCPPGFSCDDAIPAEFGTHTTDFADFWYIFTPEETGMYLITTCESNTCDTRTWIYDYCNMNNFDETNEAAIYYDDNEGGCGEQAQMNALLEAGETYYIRIGETEGGCEGSAINWELSFNGPPAGCTDPVACNYNPLAEIDLGNCIYQGDPTCTGPNLEVVYDAIVNSLNPTYLEVSESDCYINEGCVNGFGTREIIRFTTHIKNTGDLDYYIGPAGDQFPDQFEFDQCHNHWHYAGYARYDLYDQDGTFLPIGFKNGFCVIDLECSGGGTAQYGCGNMGITAGCGDIYGSGLSCQWIDVTNIEDGIYSLVVKVNWDQTPDALGHDETTYDDNYAQVCIEIDRSSDFVVNLVEGCEIIIDCEGTEWGNAQQDCNGDCNGTALHGDLDNNGQQEFNDAYSYVQQILGDDITASACNDLNQDGDVNVTDAAMMALCQFFNVAHEHPDSSGVHNKCNFPGNDIINIFDSVTFRIGNVNLMDNYLDVHVLNPYNRIVGYQIELSGLEITEVHSLYDPVMYPIEPSYVLGGNQVIGLSYEDSTIAKNFDFTPLCRVYFTSMEEELCISEIIDVVNHQYYNTMNFIEDGCVQTVGISEFTSELSVNAYPNPFSDFTTLKFSNPTRSAHVVEIIDVSGRLVRSYENITNTELKVERDQLKAGSYFYRLKGENNQIGRLVIE